MTTYIPSLTLPNLAFENTAVSILLPVIAGAGIGYATRPTETQNTYRALRQPPLNPPAWLFGPVWTSLYATMGYVAHRAWTAGTTSANPATVSLAKQGATLYTIQLGLNLIWMPLFFRLNRPIAAAFDILALGGTVSYLTYIWGQVDETSGWLLAPYLGWLGFASYLCVGVGYLNNWDITPPSKRD
ncbi:hypothetical protein GRF29_77g433098 [Pseudopithomyces chartarum]|uniref:TspO/MBR-related protein n=1 Tax=Pseudopithomyces chartarum TaxID=1892770 RepID=A0AAN6LWB6_9PLEO|nr:hypothetical protein GRF29_77g433098 [Pseudopithomyces chartarum]